MGTPPPTGGTGRRGWRRPVAAAGAIAIVVAIMVVAAALAVRHQPSATRVSNPPRDPAERAAARMVSKVSAVAAGLERAGEWGEAITEDEANAWLAQDLPRLAAGRLPAGWHSLSVRFHPGRVACSGMLGGGLASARWWAILEVSLPRADELVVAVDSAGLGLVPVPAGVVLSTLDRLAKSARWQGEIRVHDGRPRLHLLLPGRRDGARVGAGGYHLEGLRIDEGELVFTGSTRPGPPPRASTRAP